MDMVGAGSLKETSEALIPLYKRAPAAGPGAGFDCIMQF
jgi:hypothetical protein